MQFFICSFFFYLLASRSGNQSTYKLALPPTYSVTWWRSQRFKNGSISRRLRSVNKERPNRRNYTEFATDFLQADLIELSHSPQTIQVRKMMMMISLFLSFCREKVTEALYINRTNADSLRSCRCFRAFWLVFASDFFNFPLVRFHAKQRQFSCSILSKDATTRIEPELKHQPCDVVKTTLRTTRPRCR